MSDITVCNCDACKRSRMFESMCESGDLNARGAFWVRSLLSRMLELEAIILKECVRRAG